jgi:hypothetical protein
MFVKWRPCSIFHDTIDNECSGMCDSSVSSDVWQRCQFGCVTAVSVRMCDSGVSSDMWQRCQFGCVTAVSVRMCDSGVSSDLSEKLKPNLTSLNVPVPTTRSICAIQQQTSTNSVSILIPWTLVVSEHSWRYTQLVSRTLSIVYCLNITFRILVSFPCSEGTGACQVFMARRITDLRPSGMWRSVYWLKENFRDKTAASTKLQVAVFSEMLVLMHQTTISHKSTVLRHHHARHCITSMNIATDLATDYGINGGDIIIQFPGRANILHPKAPGSALGLNSFLLCVRRGGGGSFLEGMATGA